MKDWQEVSEALKAPFHPSAISWRVGSTNKKKHDAGQAQQRKGQPLAYIDARDVMNRLDEAVGPENWQDDYKEVQGRVVCTITINGVSKSDGAGDTDMEGEKGGLSDAFKRAAVKWGIGRYLYDIKAGWIELNEFWGIPDSQLMKLQAMLPAPGKAKNPGVHKPSGEAWEELSDFMRIALTDIAMDAIGTMMVASQETGELAIDDDGALEAWRAIKSKKLNNDEVTALWTRFDSEQRAALKRANEIFKKEQTK